MNKKYIFISFLVTIFLFLPLRKVLSSKKDIILKMELKTQKDLELQVFYKTEKNELFSEKKSIKQNFSKTNDEFKNLIIKFSNVEKIEELRIDFGNYPEKVQLKSVEIQGRKNRIFLPKEIIRFSMNQIEDKNIKDNLLEINSNQVDPYIIFQGEKIKNKPQLKLDYLQSISIFILIFFFTYKFLCYLSSKKNNQSWGRVLYLSIYIVVIIFSILKIDNSSKDLIENRALAQKSQMFKSEKLNLNYGKEMEKWLNDHFYKRREIINLYNFINKKINRKVENDRAFVGREGWLFYKGDNSIQNFQNVNLFTEEQLKKIEINLFNRKDWLEKQGIKYYTFIAPDKNKIYGEYYPKYIKKANETGKAHQLREYLKGKEVEIIYPYEELMSKKNKELIYWKTDTHWNQHGAFIGYENLMKRIKEDFKDIFILTLDDFNIEYQPYGGDLLNMLQIDNEEYKNIKYPVLISKEKINYEYIKNEGRNGIITKDQKPLKVLIFRDSFCSAMIPYISQTFGEVIYIWSADFNKIQDEIIKYKPDIVIHEMVERYIGVLERNTSELKEVK